MASATWPPCWVTFSVTRATVTKPAAGAQAGGRHPMKRQEPPNQVALYMDDASTLNEQALPARLLTRAVGRRYRPLTDYGNSRVKHALGAQ